MEVEARVQPLISGEKDRQLSFAELYDTYFDRVNRYFRYRAPSLWDADDLTAQVFIKALEKYHQFRGEAPVAVWLFRITHNAYVDYMRSRNRLIPVDSGDEAAAGDHLMPEEQFLRAEEMARLREVLDTMDPDQRDVISLRYAGDLRFGQIARVLEKSESAVRMIHHRALKVLRARLGGEG